LRIHVNVAMLVMAGGWYFHIKNWQWAIITLAIAMVVALELVNTALEAVVDLASPEFHPLAKLSKDAAAGAVLIIAGAAVVLGILVYLPSLGNFGVDFMVRWHHNPISTLVVILGLIVGTAVLWGIVPVRQHGKGGQNRFGETH